MTRGPGRCRQLLSDARSAAGRPIVWSEDWRLLAGSGVADSYYRLPTRYSTVLKHNTKTLVSQQLHGFCQSAHTTARDFRILTLALTSRLKKRPVKQKTTQNTYVANSMEQIPHLEGG